MGSAPVLRAGARPGQVLCVTGPLGRSAAGRILFDHTALRGHPVDPELILAHRRPTPRLAIGQALARAGAGAMMDISDGLCMDAARMALSSWRADHHRPGPGADR